MIEKYFKPQELPANDGFFIDYYIKQNENQKYVTNDFQKFEINLLENVKKIRDGSILLK